MNESAASTRPVSQTVRERRPDPVLAQHVTCVWVQEVSVESAPFVHRRAPNGSAEIVCALGSMPRVLGPQTGPLVDHLGPGTTIVGVRLRPGAAPPVLQIPACETADLDLSADDLWGSSAVALGEALAGAASPDDAAALLERAVADRLADGPDLDAIAAEAAKRLLPIGAKGIHSLASSLYMSERQLRRRFEASIGLPPKTLQRILRFQRFIALAWTLDKPSKHLARPGRGRRLRRPSPLDPRGQGAGGPLAPDPAPRVRTALRLRARPCGVVPAAARRRRHSSAAALSLPCAHKTSDSFKHGRTAARTVRAWSWTWHISPGSRSRISCSQRPAARALLSGSGLSSRSPSGNRAGATDDGGRL